MSSQSRKKKSLKNKEIDFMKLCLLLVFVLLISFTIVILILFSKTGTEPSTLITAFFTTFSFELVSCALIRIFKLKFPSKKNNEDVI